MLEDNRKDGNEANKGQTEAADNGDREMATSSARAGSLHYPPSEIRLPSHLICIHLEAEEWEVRVLALESEAASEE